MPAVSRVGSEKRFLLKRVCLLFSSLFIFGCAGTLLLPVVFSLAVVSRGWVGYSLVAVRASHCSDFSCRKAQTPGTWVWTQWCVSQALEHVEFITTKTKFCFPICHQSLVFLQCYLFKKMASTSTEWEIL